MFPSPFLPSWLLVGTAGVGGSGRPWPLVEVSMREGFDARVTDGAAAGPVVGLEEAPDGPRPGDWGGEPFRPPPPVTASPPPVCIEVQF